jgi:hypothetical protein
MRGFTRLQGARVTLNLQTLTDVCPPLWSSGQSSWLQIQRSGFDFRRYQVFWEVVGLDRGPLSLVSINEELLERKSSGTGLEIREYGRRDRSRWPRDTPVSAKVGINFADKWRSIGWYSSFADWSYGVCSFICLFACFNWYMAIYLRKIFHSCSNGTLICKMWSKRLVAAWTSQSSVSLMTRRHIVFKKILKIVYF